MATSIASGAPPPRVAVALSAVLNFVGAFATLQRGYGCPSPTRYAGYILPAFSSEPVAG